jgi:DnaJ-class molecular chaperone
MAEILGKCQWCDGTGTSLSGGESSSCYKCNGTGRSFLADISLDDMNEKMDDILGKCKKILKALNME